MKMSKTSTFFFRLKAYINKGSEPYRSQLQPVLYPLFVHLYLDQLCNGHKTPGKVPIYCQTVVGVKKGTHNIPCMLIFLSN